MKNKNFENGLPQVLSIEAVNNIVLSENGKIIHPRKRLWYQTQLPGETNSVAFDTNSPNDPQLIVRLLNQNLIPPGALLRGIVFDEENKVVMYSGTIVDGSQPTIVTAVKKPEALSQLPEDMLYWEIEWPDEEPVSIGSSFIEMFWVNLKHVPSSFCKKGTPVELLRRFASLSKSDIFSESETPAIPVSTIVNSVFSCFPPRYDVWQGANYFTSIPDWNNITLYYSAYLYAHQNSPNSILNCYDTAAVLQYALRYNGYACAYCYMNPFGYLFLTDLIGRGQCNNPFYGSTGSWPVVYQNDPNRTAFGNHAFIAFALPPNNIVADACAGPHIGNETAAQYVNLATDPAAPNPPRVPRGNPGNIGYYNGVTSVNTTNSIVSLTNMPHIDEFKNIVKYSEADVASLSNRFVAGRWPEVLDCALLHGTWEKAYEEIIPGEQEVLKMIFLRKEEKILSIRIHVGSGDNQLMHNRFLSLSISQMNESPYKKGADDLGTYSAINKNEDAEYRRCFWVYHNAVMDVMTNDDTLDITELGKWYFKWAQKNLVDDLKPHLPSAVITSSGMNAKSLGDLHVSLVESRDALIDFVHTEDTPRLIYSDDKSLAFDRLQPNHKMLAVLVADKRTLLVNKTMLKLNDL